MKLARLLEAHGKFKPPGALHDNFGDGYLLQHNRIYRNVRAGAGAAGFKYSSERNDLYSALPLSQLGAILADKVIPYLNNVAVLRAIETQRPAVVEWDDIRENYRRNFVFHESGHAVAVTAVRASLGAPAAGDRSGAVLRALLEESFTNTCELLAAVDAEDAVHRIFYEANSYTSLFEERSNLKRAGGEFGEKSLFKILWLAYLHSNFLKAGWDDSSWNRVLKFAGVDPKKNVKGLRALSRVAFQLDPNFRTVTTGFYFRFAGIKGQDETLLSFDFMALLEKDAAYARLFEKLSDLALGAGPDSRA